MPLAIELGLDPGDIVLDEDPAPPTETGIVAPLFGPCLLWSNGCRSQQVLSSCCHIFVLSIDAVESETAQYFALCVYVVE